MAAHCRYPPDPAEPFVRGDPATFALRFRIAGEDQDITTWTWRCHVRDRMDGSLISECIDFETAAPVDLPDLFAGDPSTVDCVLLAHFSDDDTSQWSAGYVADIEQLAPTKRTWLIVDQLRVDKDVSYEAGRP